MNNLTAIRQPDESRRIQQVCIFVAPFQERIPPINKKFFGDDLEPGRKCLRYKVQRLDTFKSDIKMKEACLTDMDRRTSRKAPSCLPTYGRESPQDLARYRRGRL